MQPSRRILNPSFQIERVESAVRILRIEPSEKIAIHSNGLNLRRGANTNSLEHPQILHPRVKDRSLYRLRFLDTFYVRSRQGIDQFDEACLVRITNGRLAIWLHPVGMLQPQVGVNLLPELGERMNLVRHGPPCQGFRDVSRGFLQCLGGMVDQTWHALIAK